MKHIKKKIMVERIVTKCNNCPFFEDHPYEPCCGHKSLTVEESMTIIESRDQIYKGVPDKCPLLKE